MTPCYTDEIVELFSGAPLRGHVPLITTLSDLTHNSATVVEEKLNVEDTNWEEWSHDLETSVINDMNPVNYTDDPMTIWNYLESKIKVVSNRHCKMKKSTHIGI